MQPATTAITGWTGCDAFQTLFDLLLLWQRPHKHRLYSVVVLGFDGFNDVFRRALVAHSTFEKEMN